MPTQVYHLPDLLALVSTPAMGYLNPNLKQSDKDFNDWIRKTVSPAFAEEVYKAQIPYLNAAMSPHASYQELKTGNEIVLSTLILEVLTDNRSSVESTAASQAWMNIVRGNEDVQGFDHPLLQTVRNELVPSIKTAMEPFFWSQIVTACEEYSSNVVNEAFDREAYANKSQVRDIPAYLEMRRGGAALRMCFVNPRAFQNIRIPDELLAHPLIREIEDASADMSVLTNASRAFDFSFESHLYQQDIYSYKKEYGRDECLNNLLTVLQNDLKTAHLTFQECIDFSGKLWAEAFNRFEACKSRLPSFGSEVDKHIAVYVEVLLEHAVGNVEWSLFVPRYHTFDSESDRKNNILRLTLDESDMAPTNISSELDSRSHIDFFDWYYSARRQSPLL